MNVCGVDLSQHKPAVFQGSTYDDPFTPQELSSSDILPAVSLPLHPGESPLFGDQAATHRRGAGLPWPVEAMGPLSGGTAEGVGRIPLVLAWAGVLNRKISSRFDETQRGQLPGMDFSWCPQAGLGDRMNSWTCIGGSMAHWAGGCGRRAVFVVPDQLNEAGQQALLDALSVDAEHVFLLPRPMALALVWCRRNAPRFQHIGSSDTPEEGLSVGHVWVASLAMDIWELDLIEIRARNVGGKTWLIPVHNRTSGCELPFWGIDLIGHAVAETGESLSAYWNRLFATTVPHHFCTDSSTDSPVQSQVRSFLDGADPDRVWRELDTDAVRHSIGRHRYRSGTDWATSVQEIVERKRGELGETADVLGAVVAGSLAPAICQHTRFLSRVLPDNVPTEGHACLRGDHRTAAEGALYAAYDMQEGNPCYRDTLWPIELYALDEEDTPVWPTLIPKETVEAGKAFRSANPIKGFQIAANSNHLDITLRRPLPGDKDFIYREVPVELFEKAQEDLPILITAQAAPGQGFAKARVDAEGGDYLAMLNWAKMKPAAEPEPPPPRTLSFIPHVSVIQPDQVLWKKTGDLIRQYIQAAASPSLVSSGLVWKLIGNEESMNFNAWPFLHDELLKRGTKAEPDWFLHCSVFGTSATINQMCNPRLVREFRKAVAAEYRKKASQPLLRMGGWMYDLIPDSLRNSVREVFIRFNSYSGAPEAGLLKIVHLHVAGLCWQSSKECKLFFKAFETAIRTGLIHDRNGRYDSPRNAEHENEWFRAFRNIVRFRDEALSLESVDGAALNTVSEHVISVFGQLVDRLYIRRAGSPDDWRKLYNCLRAAPFMLKRRRYERDFLEPGSPLYESMKTALNGVSQHGKEWQVPFAETTLKFLDEEAEQEDVSNILRYVK